MGQVTFNGTVSEIALGFSACRFNGRLIAAGCSRQLQKRFVRGVGTRAMQLRETWTCPDDECEFSPGDRIDMSSVDLLFIEVVRMSYFLQTAPNQWSCRGRVWSANFGIGIGVFRLIVEAV
jgi:hypothetical protein